MPDTFVQTVHVVTQSSLATGRAIRLRCLGALAVNDGGRRARFPSLMLARRNIEFVMDALQRAVPLPQHKVGMCRALRWQILRQRLPLATRSTARRRSRSRPREHSPRVAGRRVWPAGSSVRSAPIRHRSDRWDNVGRDARRYGDVQASTWGTPRLRFGCQTRNHNRFIRLNNFQDRL